jgi:hypothetical protein
LSVLFFALTAYALAEDRECTVAQAKRADTAVDTLSSWDRIYQWYATYHQCDDGGIAEGVSEGVTRNMVDRWQALPQMAQFAGKTPNFRRFVLKHIDATLNPDDLKKIGDNATSRCPAGLLALCKDISKQSGDALQEQRDVH